ncbi:MAG: GNAT family N-acetyltransferase [Burkholderiaceae bacterium]
MNKLSVATSELKQSEWDELHHQAGAALQQSWAYGAALASQSVPSLRLIVYRGESPVGMAQFILRRWVGPLGLSLCARGPVWLTPLDTQERSDALSLLKKAQPLCWPSATIVSPDLIDCPENRQIHGFRRVVTGYSTVRISLGDTSDVIRAGQHPKWRNRLVAAEASELRIERGGTKPAQLTWLLDKEGLQRQERAYTGLPVGFVQDYIAASADQKNAALLLKANLGKNTVAAMLFLIHGSSATYHIGWSDDEGRRLSAHNLILWRAILELKDRGITALDLGGVNTGRSAGLARFKIGAGGEVQSFIGSYC